MTTPEQALTELWQLAGGAVEALDSVTLHGEEPVLPSVFRVGTAAAATTAASGLAASELWRLRSGRRQTVTVDMRAAAIAFRAERYLRIDDGPPPSGWDDLAGYYQTGDGRWIQLHTNFPHHRAGALEVLGCEPNRDAVTEALRGWEGPAIDDALAERGPLRRPHALQRGVGAAPPCRGACDPARLRDRTDRRRRSRAAACRRSPALRSARTRPHPGHRRPGLRSRARLPWSDGAAGSGSSPSEPSRAGDRERPRQALGLHRSTSGRRPADRLHSLVREADVFVQGYRPGAIASHGFSPEELARERPGIVCVSLSAYGRKGPWSGRRGFDSLVQIATGIADAGSRAAGVDGPKPLPCQALDHGSGFLCAFGAIMGLVKRCEEGGSWHVRLSLAQTGRWIEGLGRIDALGYPDPAAEDVADLLDSVESPFGKVTYVRSPVGLGETPPLWQSPPVPLGTHPPEWPG